MKNRDVALHYRVVGVGAEGGVLPRLDSLLADSQGELYLVCRAGPAIEMVRTLGPVDLMLVDFPLDGTSLDTFFEELYREVEMPPRVAVLCADENGGGLPDLSAWNCTVLSCDRTLDQLAAALKTMLERAPRVGARLMVRLEVLAQEERRLRLAQTENISKTGMLLRTDEEFPPEASVRFELAFPHDPEPICGRARVVRAVDPRRERLKGVGVRFQALLGTDQLRLERFLAGAIKRERATRAAGGDGALAAAAS